MCASVRHVRGAAKTAEPIVRGLTHVGPRNTVLDGGQDRTNPFASSRDDKSAMRPFAKLLLTLVLLHCWLGHLTCKIVSETTYNVSSGTLNPTIPYNTILRL